ncbi:MAG: Gfo/Idh/MocA family oxidoreductase [Planctomycetes bacterium]|nr:Gfo/Idh/MocA family oxidoreductase [Planctomycetota bacterium]
MARQRAATGRMTRRRFLRRAAGMAAGLAGPYVLTSAALGAGGRAPASERITLGFIGTGSHGIGRNLRNFLPQPDAQVLALCDVDSRHLQQAVQVTSRHYAAQRPDGTFKGLVTTKDWREVVDRPDIDAVMVSTPDHWHVLTSLAAVRAGKDVMCEKPLTLTVREGRVLSDAVSRYGAVFQTASENRSKANFLRACELVRNGRIGRLHTIRTVLPRGGRYPNSPPEPVPEGLDWDMWLGQAPWRPYCNFGRDRCHYQWRWIFDYSGGQLTDWGAHINDIAQWGNDTEHTGPISVHGRGVFPKDGLYNTAMDYEIHYEYANGVRLICTAGTPSIRFEGSDGWIFCQWNTFQASRADLLTEPIGPNEIHLRTCPQGEQRDFLNCVKSRRQPYYPAEIGHRSVTVCHIGNISMLLGRKLRWDPGRERFIDDETANRMLARAMRQPWHL